MSEQLRRYAQAEYGVDVLAVTFHLAYLGDSRKPLALPARGPTPAAAAVAAPAAPAAPAQPAPAEHYPWEPWHTENFEMVCVEGVKYEFGPVARLIVKRLWEAWQAGRPDVETATLRRVSGSQTEKLSTLFAGNKAWGTLIIKGAGSSCYRLSMRCATDPLPADEE